MKKIILISSFLISGMVIIAQNNTPANTSSEAKRGQSTNPEIKAKQTTSRMVEELGLTADQQAKVQLINLEKVKALEINREKSGTDTKQFELGKKGVLTKWDADLSAVFNAEQLIKWEKFKVEKKAETTKKAE